MRTIQLALLAVAIVCASALPAFAVDPHLNSITPHGAQRGTDAVVTFSGVNLNDAPEIVAYYPGITVVSAQVLSRDQVKVTLKIAPECRLGEHAFRVRTSGGFSELRTFWIGALPVVDEKEPNNEFLNPQAVPLGCTVHGSIGSEDVDYFVVDCKKGQRLSAEIEGMRLGVGFFDPYIAILDSRRFELAMSDDSPMVGQDGGCSTIVPADGKYLVMVRDSSYVQAGQYRLHIGTFPRPTAIIPAGGKPGEELEVRFVGDPAGEIKQKIKLPATGDELFRIHCQTADGIHPAGHQFRIIDLPNTIETANANTAATAPLGPVPGAFNGVVSAPNETDYYRFKATKGAVYQVQCYARRAGSQLDPVVHISAWTNNAPGAYLIGNDDSAGPDSVLRFTAPADGEYVVWIHDHLRKGAPDYFYRIAVNTIQPLTTTNIPKVDGNNVSNQDRQVITVAKGNRYATLVQVNRADWGGPGVLALDKLPPGVTIATDTVDPGQGVVPVVIEAKADAPTGGVLTEVRVNPADANVKAPSSTKQDVNFNIGINNTPFHRHYVDRIAIAVTEAVPFSLEIVEPKVPLVQNGTMNLKAIIKRAPGYKNALTIIPVFTPPGLGFTGSVAVPENATEAFIPINAAPNAAARKWKSAFIAVASVTGGPAPKPNDPTTAQSTGNVWASSQLFTLEVAPPFVVFAQERTAVEQGQKTQLVCKLTVTTPFEGKAKATVVGLPAKVTIPPMEFTKDTKELVFEVTTDLTSPAGKHGTFCQVIIEKGGEAIAHNVGGGELRIDVPLPPKVAPVAAAPPPPMPAKPAAVAPAAPPMPKRLTRLEQLRLDQEEREKAAKAGTPPPAAAPPKK